MRFTKRGFVLLEAIIALVVSAVGLLGIVLFTSSMVGQSSQAKSESEALAIAQKEIEILRGYAGSYSLNSIVSNTPGWPVSTSAPGTRENYSISGDVAWSSSVGASLADASVTVSWAEGSVTLNTTIVDDMFDSRAEGGNGGGQAGSNPFDLTPPTGGAQYGADAPGGNLPEGVTLTGDQISVVSVQQGEGGGIKLVFTDDNVEYELLTYSGSAFSEIRGVVYVDYSATGLDGSEENYNKLVVRASDTGVCPRSDAHPVGGDSDDWFVEYRCFFGAGWYGNIDVVYDAVAESDTYRNQCVGDPDVSDDGTDLSRHPNWIEPLDDRREFRGYGLVVTPTGGYESDSSGNLLYVAQGLAEGAVYGYGVASEAGQSLVIGDGNHDFILEKQPNGNPSSLELDTTCGTVMSTVSVATYDGHFPGAGVDAGAFDDFNSNNGDFVCLQVNGTFSCPADIPNTLGAVTSAATYTISGTISQASTSSLVSTATSQFPTGVINNCTRDSDGNLSCTSDPICTNTSTRYSCSVIVASGASWSGSITHTVSDSNYSICEPSGGMQLFTPIYSSVSGAEVVVVESEVCGSGVTEQTTYSITMTNNSGVKYDLRDYTEYLKVDGVAFKCTDSSDNNWNKGGDTTQLNCAAPNNLNNDDVVFLDGSSDITVDITEVTGTNVTAKYP